MFNASINASAKSPNNSASSTRVSSSGSFVPFRNAIATTNLDPPTLHTIIDALVETLNSHHRQYQCQVWAQHQKHKAAIDKLEEDLEFAQSHLLDYQETFVKAPDRYIANNRLPTFTIPLGEGSDVPTKWIKQLNDGRIAGYSEHDGTGDLPYVKEIYAAPQDTALNPPEVLPFWIWETLQGASIQYQEFHRTVWDLNDWGLYAEVVTTPQGRLVDQESGGACAILRKTLSREDSVLVRSVRSVRQRKVIPRLLNSLLKGLILSKR